ncbi:MAG: multifunctional CCA addition/repair protein [Candidatus Eutrophobiaceae bacterium]
MAIYLVGGAVRDALLGCEVCERDYVVVGSTPEKMLAQGFKAVGKDFPVFLHPKTKMEYALARTERKTQLGHKGFAFNVVPDISLEEDLRRRDLTVNAMAMDDAGEIVDPYGGQADLQARLLRHVSPAFAEDPLRVLRAARFAAQLDFQIAPETLELMRRMSASGELGHLVPERVWRETEKALRTPAPIRYIQSLRECGALAAIFPEIDCLFGIPQTKKWHPEVDTGIHTLMTLEQACKLTEDPEARFAALVHDLGKATTPKDEWPSHKGHDIRGVKIIEKLCKRIKTPKRYADLACLVSRYHIELHHVMEMHPSEIMELAEKLDALRKPERLRQFLLCGIADFRGRLGMEDKPYPQAEYLQRAVNACKAVDTRDFQERGLQGREFAQVLRQRRIQAIKDAAEPMM